MRTVTCPLCGLRYAYDAELELHVRDDHTHVTEPERQDVITVKRRVPVPERSQWLRLLLRK
jgi:hypothetical protein